MKTRRTNGHFAGLGRWTGDAFDHAKKVANHEHAVALSMMHYNFCRIHASLRVTPAMAAGVTDHVWELHEVVSLLDGQAEKAA